MVPVRILLTGFGDFGEHWRANEGRPNPSWQLAQALAAETFEGACISARLLPVTIDGVERFLRDLVDDVPELVLSLGVTSHKAQVEEAPANVLAARVDGNGEPLPAGPITDRVAPGERLTTLLPMARVDRALAEVSPRTLGTDGHRPGGLDPDYSPDDSFYLCNYLNFRLTQTCRELAAPPIAGFIHVRPETSVTELAAVVRALLSEVPSRLV